LTFSFYGYAVAIMFYGLLSITLGGAALTLADISCLAMGGILAGVASIFLMTAFQYTPVSLVAPFQYTQIIWGALAGYFLWSHVPESRLILGAIIVIACGIYVVYQETHGSRVWARRSSDNKLHGYFR
jgi:drug/metabolite transporter (DMT)-like permease